MVRRTQAVIGSFMPLLLSLGGEARANDEREPVRWLEVGYAGELWSNVSGGLDEGSTYLHQIDLLGGLELPSIAGADRLHLYGHLIHTNGGTFSDRYVGDAQVVSNIDAPGGLRVLEFWAEASYGGGTSLKAGLFDLNSEFDALETGAFFVNSSHGIGPDFSQSGVNGPSIFPVTALALRSQLRVNELALVRFAVLDAVPGKPEDANETSLHLSSEEGALFVGEADVLLGDAARWIAGAWGYSERFAALDAAVSEEARGWGVYTALEGELATDVSAFIRVGWATPRVHPFEHYVGTGIVFSRGLPGDVSAGLALAWAQTGDEYRDAEDAAGNSPAPYELNLELSVRFPITDWLVLQPDVQWIRYPGARRDLDDALAVGVRFEAGFELWRYRAPRRR